MNIDEFSTVMSNVPRMVAVFRLTRDFTRPQTHDHANVTLVRDTEVFADPEYSCLYRTDVPEPLNINEDILEFMDYRDQASDSFSLFDPSGTLSERAHRPAVFNQA